MLDISFTHNLWKKEYKKRYFGQLDKFSKATLIKYLYIGTGKVKHT